MMDKIGVIVILYNWGKQELENIESYAKYFDEVILIDNTEKNVSKVKSPYRYKSLGKNYGIGRALNDGIKIAKKLNLKYVVTIDQDSIFKGETAKFYKNAVNRIDSSSIIVVPKHKVEYSNKIAHEKTYAIKLLVQSGAMFSLDIFQRVGLFNEDLFIDVVDYEFGLRAVNHGAKIIEDEDIIMLHNPGKTIEKRILNKKIKFASHDPIRVYYQSRNLLWTAREYKSNKIFRIYVRLLIKILILFDRKKESLKMYILGTRDATKRRLGEVTI